MPTVSIIVPVYNCEKYICHCVDSVLSQTFKDYKLILVDDGSKDQSGMILDEYARADSRIIVIHKENEGPSYARNAGLDAASGRFLYFLDSDDYIEPDLLEKTVSGMEAGYDTVAFCFRTVHEGKQDEKQEIILCQKQTEILLDTDEKKYAFITGPFRMKAIRWEVWNKLFRRDLIEKWNLRFVDNRRIYAEEMCFSYCYMAHASKILIIPDILYTYRKNPDSITNNIKDRLLFRTSNLMTEEIREHIKASEDCQYLYEHFSPLYYLLHKAAIRRLRKYQWENHLDITQARDIVKSNVTDYPAFKQLMTKEFFSAVVQNSYRQDKNALLQLTDRAYIVELFDIPVSLMSAIKGKLILHTAIFAFHMKKGLLHLLQ